VNGTSTGASAHSVSQGVEQEQEESEEGSTDGRVLDLADALRAAVEEEAPAFSPLSAPCAELPPWCQPTAAHAAAAPAPDAAEEDAPHDASAWEEPRGEAAGMEQEARL
jgi:hypothetical protein